MNKEPQVLFEVTKALFYAQPRAEELCRYAEHGAHGGQ